MPVLDSYDAKIDSETGELMVKGPSVMKGYYNNPEKTAEVLEPDGWLHTGDIGEFDHDGRLYITGRIKNMIVLSGGKKVFPEEVETVLEQDDNFAEVCVFGAKRTTGAKDGTEEIMTVIVPTDEILKKYSYLRIIPTAICIDDAKRSSGTHGGKTWRQGLWSAFCSDSILHRARNCFSCASWFVCASSFC